MKTIVVDDELYSFLLRHTQEIGESASSIIRRLVGLDARPEEAGPNVQEVFTFLKSPELYSHMTKAQKFLFILSWAFQKHPTEFEKVLFVQGHKRKYFAQDPEILIQSGESTNPRQIPSSPFWVITNSSTAKKAEILSDVFRLLGYSPAQTQAMLRTF